MSTKRRAARVHAKSLGRDAILSAIAERGAPSTFEQIALALGASAQREIDRLRRRIEGLEHEGRVIRDRRGRFGLVGKMDLVTGRVIGR